MNGVSLHLRFLLIGLVSLGSLSPVCATPIVQISTIDSSASSGIAVTDEFGGTSLVSDTDASLVYGNNVMSTGSLNLCESDPSDSGWCAGGRHLFNTWSTAQVEMSDRGGKASTRFSYNFSSSTAPGHLDVAGTMEYGYATAATEWNFSILEEGLSMSAYAVGYGTDGSAYYAPSSVYLYDRTDDVVLLDLFSGGAGFRRLVNSGNAWLTTGHEYTLRSMTTLYTTVRNDYDTKSSAGFSFDNLDVKMTVSEPGSRILLLLGLLFLGYRVRWGNVEPSVSDA